MKIAVFASGSGSNFAAIVQAIQMDKIQGVDLALLVCDRPDALVVKKATDAFIPVFSFKAKDYENKVAYEIEIIKKLKEKEIDFIVLAGYMRIVGSTLLKEFEGRIINLHPSLLPAFQGKDAIGQALDYGVKITGVTVHFVDAGMDTGPIIAQRPVVIAVGETKESLSHKIQEQEHQILPEVINWIQKGLVQLKGRKVDVYEKSFN
ncbi:MAG TPA: phosphoribosylglycinamide formyltransferase [Bacillota bacterium]|nr:phosphoribosylglycinamide formyltransferase [Bacillota bacterium]